MDETMTAGKRPDHIIYGDTDSVYLTVQKYLDQKKNIEDFEERAKEVIALSDAMEQEIIASFPRFVSENFLTNGVRSNGTVVAVRDVVAPRAIFRSGKKTYAMWIIDSEHKPKDEIKIVGMATRRSDTPKVLQKFIESCIEKVLKENMSYPDLYRYVQDYRKNVYRQSEPWRRGSPQRIKNLTAKMQELDRYEKRRAGKLGRAMKKPLVHFSLMAAMNTNKLIEEHQEKRWDKIRDGDKIEIIALKKNERGFKTVAIKTGETYIPEWFKELPFDRKQMEFKMFDKKLYNTLGEILDWDFTFVDNYADQVFKKKDFFDDDE